MKNIIKRFSIIGAIFVWIAGTLLHFLYDWTGNNSIVGIFSAVDESTFEHLKLFIWPYLFFTFIEYMIYGAEKENFTVAKTIGLLTGIVSILVLFYTYSGILGFSIVPIDIGIFYVSVMIAYYVSYLILIKEDLLTEDYLRFVSWIIIVFVIVSVVVFTYNKPDLGLFIVMEGN